jgi:hypothetical protein
MGQPEKKVWISNLTHPNGRRTMVPIHGNTYHVRNQLKALGGKWHPGGKCWMVPADKADEARKLVGDATAPARCGGVKFAPRTCRQCGCRINYGAYCGKCEFS